MASASRTWSDDEAVRGLVRSSLEQHGYTVLEASSGDQALAVAERHSGPIHLLMTDTVMPRMRGPELAAQLQESRPETRALFTSGYADAAVLRHGVLGPEVAFIGKPFTPSALVCKVREVLDAGT